MERAFRLWGAPMARQHSAVGCHDAEQNVAVVGKIISKTAVTAVAIAKQNELIRIGKTNSLGQVVSTG
jgi:hypothetical protein